MKFTRICYKSLFFFYFFAKYKSFSIAFSLSNNNVTPKKCSQISKIKGNLLFERTGSKLPIYLINKYYKKALYYIIEIFNTVKIESVENTEKGILITTGKLSCYINNESHAGNFYEIIVRKFYNYYGGSQKKIVLDIGMNMGLASLFFASKNDVEKVYAYEPFSLTFEDAIKNFSINTSLKKKIIPSNFGISNKNTFLKVPTFVGGSMEASVNEEFLKHQKLVSIENKNKTIEVEVRNITNILKEIIENETKEEKKSFLLKIDCEGEEYAIIDELDKEKLLSEIDIMFIEWHYKGPDPLIHTLVRNNFTILDMPITTFDGNITKEAGMLYVFKN